MHIWNNVFVSNTELLLQVLVDGCLWEMDELGIYRAILFVEEIEFDEARGIPIAAGINIKDMVGRS